MIAPLVVIAIGGAGLVALVATKPTPQKTAVEPLPTRVEIRSVRLGSEPIRVSGMGTVIPARQVELRPEVSGRILEFHERLVPGATFPAGSTLLSIDAADYRFALEQARADVERARFELEIERGRQTIAKKEFELLGRDKTMAESDAELALRRPHLRNAKATLTSAKARLEQAKLNLERTSLRAPFNAFVQSESVDLGQLVTPNTVVATLVGTDVFWVQLSVPVSALEWLRDEASIPAVIRHQVPGSTIEKDGHVIHVLPDLDPRGRMARVLVAIDDPLDLEEDPALRRPLLLSSYVEVLLRGRTAEQVAVVPRSALRDGSQVYLMNADEQLEIRTVSTVWRGRTTVYVDSGLEDGDRLITSRIAAPVRGMRLRDREAPLPRESSAQL